MTEPATPDLASLLLKGLTTVTTAVAELAKSAIDLRDQSAAERAILAQRSKYFKIFLVLLAVLVVAVIAGGIQLNNSGEQRSEQIRMVRINQECQIQVRFSTATTAEQAVAVYRACVAASK